MFTIGQFSELTGISSKRLRHYDRMALFRPAWVDPDSRYRYYSPGQLPELRRIVALIDLGVPLKDIARLLAEDADLEEVLTRQREELERYRAELDRRLSALDIQIHRDGLRDVVVRRRAPGRWISLRQTVARGADLAPLFDEAEQHAAEHVARAARPPVCVVHDSVRSHHDIELLIPVVRAVPDADPLRFVTTPACRVATHLVVGGYDSLANVADRLRHWAIRTGMTISGPPWYVYMRFSADAYLDLPMEFLTDRRHELVTEVQQPVT